MASSSDPRKGVSSAPEGPQAAPSSDSKGPSTDFHPSLPSQTAPATVETAAPQQAATQPDAGGQVTQTTVMQPARRASFNQRVVGYAKEIRGTILNDPEMKEYGSKIVKGEEPWPPASHHHDAHTTASPTPATPPADQARAATP